jgi:hypothetical protein
VTKIDYRPPADKVRESRVRRRAVRLGYRLERSRARRLHMNNEGLYMLIYENMVVEGVNYDADLDRIEYHLERDAKARGLI